MPTRVDPAMYSDTPIFQKLLEERRGRWPGIPMRELPFAFEEDTPAPPKAVYQVVPTPQEPDAATSDHDPETTAPMPLPEPLPEAVQS